MRLKLEMHKIYKRSATKWDWSPSEASLPMSPCKRTCKVHVSKMSELALGSMQTYTRFYRNLPIVDWFLISVWSLFRDFKFDFSYFGQGVRDSPSVRPLVPHILSSSALAVPRAFRRLWSWIAMVWTDIDWKVWNWNFRAHCILCSDAHI